MVGRGDDVIVVGSIAGGIAAEENLGAVEVQHVVQRVEDLRWNQTRPQAHIRASKHFCRHEFLRVLRIRFL